MSVNQALNTPEPRGDWFKVEANADGLVIRNDSEEDSEISLASLEAHGLEAGDFVRGAFVHGELIVTRCYPRELSAAK